MAVLRAQNSVRFKAEPQSTMLAGLWPVIPTILSYYGHTAVQCTVTVLVPWLAAAARVALGSSTVVDGNITHNKTNVTSGQIT